MESIRVVILLGGLGVAVGPAGFAGVGGALGAGGG